MSQKYFKAQNDTQAEKLVVNIFPRLAGGGGCSIAQILIKEPLRSASPVEKEGKWAATLSHMLLSIRLKGKKEQTGQRNFYINEICRG